MHHLEVSFILGFQVEAGAEAVDDHFKADIGQLVNGTAKHRRVLRDHVEEYRVFLRVRRKEPHLALQCQVESLPVCRTHYQLVNAERLKPIREQNEARLRVCTVHHRLNENNNNTCLMASSMITLT